MKKNKKEDQSSYVRAFSLLVDIIWIIAVVGLVLTAVLGIYMLILPSGDRVIKEAAIFIPSSLNSIIFVMIIFYLRKIIRSIKAKSPFEKANVQRIKRIAYAVFILIPIDILGKILIQGFDNIFSSTLFIDLVWGGFFKLLFIGLGILVIAKVFESGLELQKEKSLTI